MTGEQMKEVLEFYDGQDEAGKTFIMNLFRCAVAFGDAFFNSIDAPLESGNKEALRQVVYSWFERLPGNI